MTGALPRGERRARRTLRTAGATALLGALVAAPLAGCVPGAPAGVAARSAPAGDTVRLVVMADLNGSYGTVEVADRVRLAVDRILEIDPDAVLVAGDMIAGQRSSPRLTESELAAMWEAFHEAVTRPLTEAGIPLAVTPGNHDGSGEPPFANERAEYERQWRARRPDVDFVDAAGYPFDYAFRVGNVLIASLESTRISGPAPDQLAWLADLLAAEGAEPATEIVFGHLPLFPFARGREAEILRGEGLEDLLVRESVDFHLTGHHHAFYVGEKRGVTYVAQAGLGSGSRRLVGAENPSPSGLTLLEIADDGTWSIRVLTGPDLTTPLDLSTLPERIETNSGPVRRLDGGTLGGTRP